ncbi:hypothetical protein [Neptunomonas antarctica]|nr:hypothetical protein [Neptunomonas antarctica]
MRLITILFIAPLIFLSGCQQFPIRDKLAVPFNPNCFVSDNALSQFLEDEHLYIMSDATQQKKMLIDISGSSARLANLLSSTGNNKVSLEKSLLLFKQLPLLPKKVCTADRYLYLRFRQTQAHLSIIEELKTISSQLNSAEQTIEKQQQQINALTQIEPAITRQREEH